MPRHALRFSFWIALAMTLLVNGSTFAILAGGPGAALERKTTSIDEDFYMGLIREAAEGHTRLGSASMREHRDDRAVVTALPLIPGMLMRALGLPLWGAIFLMDLVCPLLIAFFFSLALWRCSSDRLTNAAATLFLLALWPADILNVVNPKMVLVPVAAYIALIFAVREPQTWMFAARGTLLSSLLYIYPHHFLFFAALEGCDALRRFLKDRSAIRRHTGNLLAIGLPFLLLGIPKFLTILGGVPTPEGADFWHRNVIESRFPSDPRMQVLLFVGIVALLWLRRREREAESRETMALLIMALIAGLIVLNQQVIHGLEIMFGLHYRLLLKLFLRMTVLLAIIRLVPRIAWQRGIFTGIGLWSAVIIGSALSGFHTERVRLAEGFVTSDISAVLDWLEKEHEEQIVLTPDAIGNLLPAFTPHYVVANGFSTFESVTDRELAERYVLKELVEPVPEDARDKSYGYVFSVAAGNRAARARTVCRIRSLFRKSIEECRVPIRDMILHQDVLRELEEDLRSFTPERALTLLRTFHVDLIVTKETIPPLIAQSCPREEQIGMYAIHRCRQAEENAAPPA